MAVFPALALRHPAPGRREWQFGSAAGPVRLGFYAAQLTFLHVGHWIPGPPSAMRTMGSVLSGNGVPQAWQFGKRRDTRHTEHTKIGFPFSSRELCMGRWGMKASPHFWQFSASSFIGRFYSCPHRSVHRPPPLIQPLSIKGRSPAERSSPSVPPSPPLIATQFKTEQPALSTVTFTASAPCDWRRRTPGFLTPVASG